MEAPQALLDRLRGLVLAADAERRELEHELHAGVQQDLVALSVTLQLARGLTEDPAALRALLKGMERDVQLALEAAARLGARLHPPLLESGSLAAAVRAVASTARIIVYVEGTAAVANETQSAAALTCLQALEHAAPGARATVAVDDDEGVLFFEMLGEGDWGERFERRVGSRVEALGGRLSIESLAVGGKRILGSVPWTG